MDDRKFDDIIKQKLSGAGQEPFDPAALAGLRSKMAQAMVQPWYAQYRNELLVAAAVVAICLFNGGLFYYFNHDTREKPQLSGEVVASTAQTEERIVELQQQIAILQQRKDTVYVNDTRTATKIDMLTTRVSELMKSNDQLLRRVSGSQYYDEEISRLKATISLMSGRLSLPDSNAIIMADLNSSQLTKEIRTLEAKINELMLRRELEAPGVTGMENAIKLGNTEDIPPNVLIQLKKNGLIREDNGIAYLMPGDEMVPLIFRKPGTASNEKVLVLLPLNSTEGEEAYADLENLSQDKEAGRMSVSMQRDIERHYSRGVGIRVGPSLAINGLREDDLTTGFGANAEFIVSPSLSIETGMHFLKIRNEVSKNIDPDGMPGFDPTVGELKTIDIESELIDIPVNLKYRYPINKGSLFGSIGVSTVWHHIKTYDYKQILEVEGNEYIVENTVGSTPAGMDIAFLNLNVGMAKLIKKQNSLELALQFKYGLKKYDEGVSPHVIGLRTAYWFKIR